MNESTRHAVSKVPAVTFTFWCIKILATTLGETGGDAVTMSMKLGYLAGTAIFAVVFAVAVGAQIRARRFHPFLFWAVIIATTTVGTTLADLFDRSLGIGYAGGSAVLFGLLMLSLWLWHRAEGTVVGQRDRDAPRRDLLLVHDPVLANARHGTRRLDGRQHRARLPRCRAGLRRGSADRRGGLLLDPDFAHRAVLGRLHPDPPAGCHGRRLPGQTARPWRARAESPIWRLRC